MNSSSLSRCWNFSAGPAALPEPVLQRAQKEMLNWNGTGCSVMEVSHRGKPFMELAERSREKLSQLLPLDDFEVLFLQGGASTQFNLIPMNLARPGSSALYDTRGAWGKKAFKAASKLMECSEDSRWPLQPSADDSFVHYTSNETIDGFQVRDFPRFPCATVCDMSSDILSRPLDMSAFDVIYAGAQKNLGPSGLTLVIIRRELLQRCPDGLPDMFNYRALAAKDSMLNTPPTFAWYLVDLVLNWIIEQGGLPQMQTLSQHRSSLLYDYIDSSPLFANDVPKDQRSVMNVVFQLPSESLTTLFVDESESAGFIGLKGHRSVGGLRASLYNAMPMQGVEALLEFMRKFEAQHGA